MHPDIPRQRKKADLMHRESFEEYLNTYLQVEQVKDYCPNGLQIEGGATIQKVATAVSANKMTIEKAVAEGFDTLLVHHGLFWGRDPYPIIGVKKQKIALLIKKEISLFAYHLPLDAHREVGNNWQAAREMQWENLEPFGELNGIEIGVKGMFSPRPVEAFVAQVEAYYGHRATVALAGKSVVQSAALISGGAYRELSKAAACGVDCFITGNFDEPAWGTAHEEQIHFLALGHAATEKVGPRALADHIRTHLGVACEFLDVPNPF